jgi:hypothetical protein
VHQRQLEDHHLGGRYHGIPFAPTQPVDERITDLDRRYILNLHQGLALDDFNGPTYIKLIYDISEPIYFATFPLGSKMYRFALLAYAASHSSSPAGANDSIQYLSKFYKYSRPGAQLTDLEVVMACYMVFSYESTQPNKNDGFFDNMMVHFDGVCGAILRLGKRAKESRVVEAVQNIFQGMLANVLWKLNSAEMTGNLDRNLVRKVGESLETAMAILNTDFPFQGITDRYLKIVALESCFDLYLTCCRTSAIFLDGLSLVHDLQSVVGEIGRLVLSVPGCRELLNLALTHEVPSSFIWPGEFGESWATRLFVHSTFICNLSNFGASQSLERPQIELSAKSLCFLYAESQLYSDEWIFLCQAVRGLFWAGLILTEPTWAVRILVSLFCSDGVIRKSINIHDA